MTLLSKACAYGLRAVLYVAAHGAGRPFVPIREVAEELGVSFHFLTKILQQLTERGIMESYRGPRGGVTLGRDAARIALMDVVQAIDGKDVFASCVMGLQHCGERRPCPLHGAWSVERQKLRALFERSTVSALAADVHGRRLRLSDSR